LRGYARSAAASPACDPLSLPPGARTGAVVLLTGAGSAVWRLTAKVLAERGVKVISLVRSEASAARLTSVLPGSPVFATELAAWKDRVRAAAEGATIHVAIDSVGGRLLGDVADLQAEWTGTVINFGSLGGETSDIRLFAPRSLTLKGVALGGWASGKDHETARVHHASWRDSGSGAQRLPRGVAPSAGTE
jgi:NADPH:quinone reductase